MKRTVSLVWIIGVLLVMGALHGPAPLRFFALGQSKPDSPPPAATTASPADTKPAQEAGAKPAQEAGQNTKAPAQALPGAMVLDDPAKPFTVYAGKKGKVPFDHGQHVAIKEYTCQTCHHTNSATLTAKVEEFVPHCVTCHKKKDSTCEVEGPFKGKDALNSKDAFHGISDSAVGAAGCEMCHQKLDKKVYPNVKDIASACALCHTGKDS